MRKITLVFCIVFLAVYLLGLNSVFASSNFSTDYDVTYSVKDNGITRVNFDITLTNNTTEYYASSYSIQVGLTDIQNLTVFDSDGSISPYITKKNNLQNIEVTFNKRSVGIGSKLNFSLSFDTNSIAKKTGKVWEVNIPGLSNQSDFKSFNVHVRVPEFLGKATYIKPNISSLNKESLDFSKEHLGKSGIYIGFGEYQIYKFNLTYHLQNSNLFKVKTEIALPPSTNYQNIEIQDINPQPLDVKIDKDGNWLAEYLLTPSQKIDVVLKGRAKLFLNPKQQIETKDKLKEYLKEQPFWDTLDTDIKNLAKTLKTPYEIYDYLVKNLTYDFSRVIQGKERLGSILILKNPKSAVCLEFTDLFIALARSAGIPAREIDGFAYTKDDKDRPLSLVKDVLHAWPEYYDFKRQTWIMIDPTWGNTTKGLDYFHTLDFDHFAFIIKGVNSEYPIPAGGYKLKGEELVKDVIVGFDDNFDESSTKLEISENFSNLNFSTIPIVGEVTIRNTGKQISKSQIATIAAELLNPNHQEFLLDEIPPFGLAAKEIVFQKMPFLTNISDVVTIKLNGESVSKNLRVIPIFLHKISLLTGGILVVIIAIFISIIIIKTRRVPVLKQEEQSTLRWQSKKSKD